MSANELFALLLLALALLVFAFALVYNVGENARNKRREQNEYHPPTPPASSALPAASSSPTPRIRWGQVEDLYEAEPSPAARGVVWGQEGLEPRDPAPRGPAPARPPIRLATATTTQEKCPTCRRRFIDTPAEAVARCATCGTHVHQECLRSLSGQCPTCHGTQFVATNV